MNGWLVVAAWPVAGTAALVTLNWADERGAISTLVARLRAHFRTAGLCRAERRRYAREYRARRAAVRARSRYAREYRARRAAVRARSSL